MISLNFSNVEELIFSNEEIHHLLPAYFFSYFEQWKLSKRLPMLRSFGKSAILDFLNQLNDAHILTLENYFGERILVEKLHYNIVSNLKISLKEKEICEKLCGLASHNYFCVWRDEEFLYVTLWR